MAERPVSLVTDCHAFIPVDTQTEGGGGILACWLQEGHAGPHFDLVDKLEWSVVTAPAEARHA